ncbi:MAG: glucose-6-phosphate isomerase, partial [Verrucomicrobiota bacterium]
GIQSAKEFAAQIHSGSIKPERAERFENLLLVGIGGSALGPQLLEDALTTPEAPLRSYFFDNPDPDGIDRILTELGQDGLERCLTVVCSKSGGTPETRNGMLHAQSAYEAAGLSFAKHAAAITGVGSTLDQVAESQAWLQRFPMADWVGGRTSIMSVVGLLPAALQGLDIEAMLAGASAMDQLTRRNETRENPGLLLALMWHWSGNGAGEKDMVVLPYKDRLVLFSKYLQQLVMESLGKEFDRSGNRVEQGIAVYGNKGSTDQHAYVQQLREGVPNFFATFLEVTEAGGTPLIVDEEQSVTSGDFLQGFLRGTRTALSEKSRESVTVTIPRVDAFHLGALIALFERAVTFYASFVKVNAYHQPGVEAGKKAAGAFLERLIQVRSFLKSQAGSSFSAEEVSDQLGSDTEETFHILSHLSSPGSPHGITKEWGESPQLDRFSSV